MPRRLETKMAYTITVRTQNSWDAKTGVHPIEAECPHKHRTESGAYDCWKRLIDMRSTKWFRAEIEVYGKPGAITNDVRYRVEDVRRFGGAR